MFLAIVVIVLYILRAACYRLYFHPLHSFPGPKLAAITSLYEFYYAVVKDGQFIWELGRLHDKYGPIVRITPDELRIRDSSFYNEIYAGGTRVREKSSSFVRLFGAPDSTVATVLSKYFSKRSVLNMQPLIQGKIDALIQHFRKAHREQRVINLSIAFSALTADIISTYAYTRDFATTGILFRLPFLLFSRIAVTDALFTDSMKRAVIKEGLQLSFGVLTRLPRVAPFEALNYKGHLIPPGTPVSQSIYFVNMDPRHFPEPHTFNPDRWLGTAEERKALESMLVSFSRGSRQSELFLTLATLVRRFDLKLVDTTLDDVEPYRDHFIISPKNRNGI
ncbi:cytochrome P450 [Aspergillus pseudonomiae]|uniref:Cytochrome P450 n=1 Tax=Aspergillus pseudonomiae TaxID=1506151 RepID=A0A5N7DBF7_9EURO|nr:cytochrome P450 [Aspergillus pseudonomiae]KAE8403677.1 cytochrome P450 [Aspergillus pseudonomiae]